MHTTYGLVGIEEGVSPGTPGPRTESDRWSPGQERTTAGEVRAEDGEPEERSGS